MVVNVLGLSKLLYVMRTLIMPNWVFSRVYQLIWPFIWGSRLEMVVQNTCFLKPVSGGIGLSNFKLKCDALKLSLVSVIDLPENSSFFLSKYFVGRHLSTFRQQWSVLHDHWVPSAAVVTPLYDACLNILAAIGDNVDLTSKKIYACLLLQSSSPPHLTWTMGPLPGSWLFY